MKPILIIKEQNLEELSDCFIPLMGYFISAEIIKLYYQWEDGNDKTTAFLY